MASRPRCAGDVFFSRVLLRLRGDRGRVYSIWLQDDNSNRARKLPGSAPTERTFIPGSARILRVPRNGGSEGGRCAVQQTEGEKAMLGAAIRNKRALSAHRARGMGRKEGG